MAKPFQSMHVRELDSDPCAVWVKESLMPVYRHNQPFPSTLRVGDPIDWYGDGRIVVRGQE